jgi:hypothetical protein
LPSRLLYLRRAVTIPLPRYTEGKDAWLLTQPALVGQIGRILLLSAATMQQCPVRLLRSIWEAGGGVFGEPEERWIYMPCSVLDQDTSAFITPDSVVSYGTCPNAPSMKRK